MGEYSLSLAEAYRFPLSAALALWPAMCARNGYQYSGPDYAGRAAADAADAMKRYLDTHFTIIPNPKPQAA